MAPALKAGFLSLSAGIVLSLPNSTHYTNVVKTKDSQISAYKNQRGVYLWTNKVTGKQYVGSSKNLGNRLIEYYRPSYLKAQAQRGSAIARALLEHGYDNFTLSIQALGPTDSGQIYSPSNLPDYVVLEQAYLSSYTLAYNVNRVASSAAYTPSTSLVNVGTDNPSYGLFGLSSYAWNNTHSEALKAFWSSTRGKYNFFVYDSSTLLLLQHFTSATQLSNFFEMSKRFGTDIVKKLQSLNQPALLYSSFIISLVELTDAQLQDLLPNMPVKAIIIPRPASPTGKVIYGYNPETNIYESWSSLEKCTHMLTGARFANKSTVNKRINKGILFHGYYLQTKPFNRRSGPL